MPPPFPSLTIAARAMADIARLRSEAMSDIQRFAQISAVERRIADAIAKANDLVTRLRAPESWRSFPEIDDDAPREAAAEIERLRAELALTREAADLHELASATMGERLHAEIAGFKTELAALRGPATDAVASERERWQRLLEAADDMLNHPNDLVDDRRWELRGAIAEIRSAAP
jgi:hypothetical protein